MRRAPFRILFLLAMLAVTVASARPARALICFIIDQHCVRCGPDLAKKCTFYECEDGSQRTSCTQCSLFCFEA